MFIKIHTYVRVCAESCLSSDDVDRDDGPFCSSANAYYTSVNEVSGHEWRALPLDMDPKSSSATKSMLEQHSVQESSVPHNDAPAAGRLHISRLDVILFVFSYNCSLSRELSVSLGPVAVDFYWPVGMSQMFTATLSDSTCWQWHDPAVSSDTFRQHLKICLFALY